MAFIKNILEEIVEGSLRKAALWDDVKDKLEQSGLALRRAAAFMHCPGNRR